MNSVNVENALMQEKARIREEVVKLKTLTFHRKDCQQPEGEYVKRSEVLAILKI